MLVVKLEMHPNGDASQATEIGRLNVANITDDSVSDYSYELFNNGEYVTTGTVGCHRRKLGAWLLVARVLHHALHDIKRAVLGS